MKLSMLAACGVLGLVVGCSGGEESFEDDPTEEDEQALASGYRARVTTNPSRVIVGAPTQLDVRVTGPRSTPVTQFDPLHTQAMHLIAVSSDLEDFVHVHPALQPGGGLTVSATFSRSEPYTLFMEYDPAGAAGQTLSRASVKPIGAQPVAPLLSQAAAFGGSVSKAVVVGATKVELVGTPGGMIMANTPTHLVVQFRKTSGAPISDLTDWLGMPAHGIIVSPDLKTFVHAHGMSESAGGGAGGHGGHGNGAAGSTTTGPVGIDVTLPKAGLYKMFVQFKRGTTVLTAPFVLSVMASHGPPTPPPPATATCATTRCPTGQSCMVMGSPPSPMCM